MMCFVDFNFLVANYDFVFSHSGNHIIEQSLEEFKTWVGELMAVFGFLFVEGDSFSAKVQG